MNIKRLFLLLLGGILTIVLWQCTNDLGTSPAPAILRVYLVTNPADTTIRIGFDTLTVTHSDQFALTIGQMKVYSNDSIYARLFSDFSGYRDEEKEYNLLQRDADSFVPQKIAETYIPPKSYQAIEFVVYPPKQVTIHGLTFPIEIPDGYQPLIRMDCPFVAQSHDEYAIYIRFDAFKSIKRWRDTYMFTPYFEIINK